jgi:malonyl CoA-acyl carrier protein transacylase
VAVAVVVAAAGALVTEAAVINGAVKDKDITVVLGAVKAALMEEIQAVVAEVGEVVVLANHHLYQD